jgi:hypothetical protein
MTAKINIFVRTAAFHDNRACHSLNIHIVIIVTIYKISENIVHTHKHTHTVRSMYSYGQARKGKMPQNPPNDPTRGGVFGRDHWASSNRMLNNKGNHGSSMCKRTGCIL